MQLPPRSRIARPIRPRRAGPGTMTSNRLSGPLADVAGDAGYAAHPERVGFFTDTSVCIGCKACEVACKEWNGLPEPDADVLKLTGMSYDNTGELGAGSWRHVAFIEQQVPGVAARPPANRPARRAHPATRRAG